jgi:hypothetical protein
MPTKRRQISVDRDELPILPEISEFAEKLVYQFLFCPQRDYIASIEYANHYLNRYERGYLAGYLVAKVGHRK